MCLAPSATAPADSKTTTAGLLIIRVIPSIGALYFIQPAATPNIYTESPLRGDRQQTTTYR